jgi:hypothetical protein
MRQSLDCATFENGTGGQDDGFVIVHGLLLNL